MTTFSRLVRFLAKDGKQYHGDAILNRGQITQARIIEGNIFSDYRVTDSIAEVQTLLAPLSQKTCSIVRCLGLNYAKHAHEAKMPIPKYPILFCKPHTSLSGPYNPIPVPLVAQEISEIDFECELVVVIGKTCRNVSEDDALNYVMGYSVGNDVSHRNWQLKRGGGQWNMGKGFDGWAPWGPAIVAASALPGGRPSNLRISTKVNGEVMQDSDTGDLIFGVAKTVSFLSQGTTLQPGNLIFTGTPAGVAMGRSPPNWLRHGDVVEVSLEGVGSCINEIAFEMSHPKDQSKARL